MMTDEEKKASRKRALDKYNSSKKGRKAQERYRKTGGGNRCQERYRKTEHGKKKKQDYNQLEKAKEQKRNYNQKIENRRARKMRDYHERYKKLLTFESQAANGSIFKVLAFDPKNYKNMLVQVNQDHVSSIPAKTVKEIREKLLAMKLN